MNRKQSTVERIRKKALAAAAAAGNSGAQQPKQTHTNGNGGASTGPNSLLRRRQEEDPFHNGQTPSCRSLLQAVHDIFPELQQEMQNPVPPSDLGQLLRWQTLKRRKARVLPPAPPLSSPSPPEPKAKGLKASTSTISNDSQTNSSAGGAAAASTPGKKKRKRRKKKKDSAAGNGASAHVSTNGGTADVLQSPTSRLGESSSTGSLPVQAQSENEEMRSPLSLLDMERMIPRDVSTGSQELEGPLSQSFLDEDEEEETASVNFEPHSVEALDRSIHELEEKLIQEVPMEPSLTSLPSDEGLNAMKKVGNSSLTFFEQIQPDSSEPLAAQTMLDDINDDSGAFVAEFSVPLSPPAGTLRSPPRRARTLSGSSFASFEGATLTPTDAIEEPLETAADANLGSPTHEWVPQDGAQAKVETPPGDVIKNPLDLPYLLTLSMNKGARTTLTINGSLISAADPSNPGNSTKHSSLETTKILLEEWMEQLIGSIKKSENKKREDDFQSFLEYLQTRLWRGDQKVGIPLSALHEAVSNIDCYACQQDAMAVVNKWAERDSTQPLVLNPIVLNEHAAYNPENQAVETAFDYVALEEGQYMPQPEPPKEEDGDGLDLRFHLSFRVASGEENLKKPIANGSSGTSTTNSEGEKMLYVDALGKKHVEYLMDHWLPCGVEEDILVATSVSDISISESLGIQRHVVLNYQETTKIQSLVLEKEKHTRDHVDEVHQIGKDLRDDLSDLLSTNAGDRQTNLEFKAFPKMKMLDQKSCSYHLQILSALRMTTLGKSNVLSELQVTLWTQYLGALNQTLKACDKYYDRIGEDLVDQRGVVPKFFVSADLRNLFQQLVEEKINAWTDLGANVCNLLKGRTLKELYTVTVWYEDRSNDPMMESDTALDDQCYNLVQELARWTETIMGNRMADIQRERMAQTERMLELLQAVVEPLAKEYSTVEMYFSAERNRYFASLRSNIVLAQGVKKRMRLIDNAEVEGMTTGVILMWCHVRVMQSRMIRSQEVPPLPLQLKRWMLQDEPVLMEEWRGTSGGSTHLNTYHQRYCQKGRGGKRRAMCSLAGLFYSWLQERCQNWVVETAERELLIDFESNAEPATANNNVPGTKSSKSKKKKKKNRNTNNSQSSLSPLVDTPPAEKPKDAPKAPPEKESPLNGLKPTLSVEESKSDDASDTSDDETPVVATSENGNSAPDAAPSIEEDNEEEEEETMPWEDEANERKVYVLDGKTKIPAKIFLVSRLRKLVDQAASGSEKNIIVAD